MGDDVREEAALTQQTINEPRSSSSSSEISSSSSLLWVGGGVIPFSIKPSATSFSGDANSSQVCILLGKENDMPMSRTRSNKWCDFSGRRDAQDESVEATAAREYYEETCAFPGLWPSRSGRGESGVVGHPHHQQNQPPWRALAERLASKDGYYYKFDRTYPTSACEPSVGEDMYTTFLFQVDYVPNIEKKFLEHRDKVIAIKYSHEEIKIRSAKCLVHLLASINDGNEEEANETHSNMWVHTLVQLFTLGQKVRCGSILMCSQLGRGYVTAPGVVETLDPQQELQVASFRFNMYTNLFEVYLDELLPTSSCGALLCCVFLNPFFGSTTAEDDGPGVNFFSSSIPVERITTEMFLEFKQLCDMREALMEQVAEFIGSSSGPGRGVEEEAEGRVVLGYCDDEKSPLVVTFGPVSLTFSNTAREAMRSDIIDGTLFTNRRCWTMTDLFLVTDVSVNECYLEKQHISWFSLEWLKETLAEGGVFGNESFRMNFTPILSLLTDVFSCNTLKSAAANASAALPFLQTNALVVLDGNEYGRTDYIVDIRPWCMSSVLTIPEEMARHFENSTDIVSPST